MSDYQIVIDGTPVDDPFYDDVAQLQVEENADLPDAIRLTLPVNVKDDDLRYVGDARVQPFANIAVVVTPADGSPSSCIFDGFVLSHKVHLEAGVTSSTLEVWGQDASVLMGVEEKVREWSGMTDGAVANQIFGEYGFTPADGNTHDDSPAHSEDGHTLMQRGSDIDFLRRLARRTGRWCRVTCADRPGIRTGFFALPDLSGDPVVTLNLNDPPKSQVAALDFHWDVVRPTKVAASQASLTDSGQDGVSADSSESGLAPLDARDLAGFAGRDTTVVLTAAGDDAELAGRVGGLLRDAAWFARCEGSADISMLKTVLRVGAVVAIEGVGTVLSGKQLVKSVRHTITANSHSMAFTLVRNALGPAAAS